MKQIVLSHMNQICALTPPASVINNASPDTVTRIVNAHLQKTEEQTAIKLYINA